MADVLRPPFVDSEKSSCFPKTLSGPPRKGLRMDPITRSTALGFRNTTKLTMFGAYCALTRIHNYPPVRPQNPHAALCYWHDAGQGRLDRGCSPVGSGPPRHGQIDENIQFPTYNAHTTYIQHTYNIHTTYIQHQQSWAICIPAHTKS